MKVGLFFGSFNPIHIGHLIIGNYVAQYALLDEVWFVVSPQSPFKHQTDLIHEKKRLHLVKLATANNPKLVASDVEFSLSRPSYTINTLNYLSQNFPRCHFSLLMGSDNLATLKDWKDYPSIIGHYNLLIYERPGANRSRLINHERVHIIEDTPLLNISSTFLRGLIKEGKSITYLVPREVENYITKKGLFK